MIGFWAFIGLSLMVSMAMADGKNKLSVTAAFGRGLNTSGADNQVINPGKIEVKKDGVVHFQVAGFHQIVILKPGEPLPMAPMAGTFVLDPDVKDDDTQFYLGIRPEGAGQDTTRDPLNDRNRQESVGFPDEKDTYFVFCNVRGHFNNGMIARIKVK